MGPSLPQGPSWLQEASCLPGTLQKKHIPKVDNNHVYLGKAGRQGRGQAGRAGGSQAGRQGRQAGQGAGRLGRGQAGRQGRGQAGREGRQGRGQGAGRQAGKAGRQGVTSTVTGTGLGYVQYLHRSSALRLLLTLRSLYRPNTPPRLGNSLTSSTGSVTSSLEAKRGIVTHIKVKLNHNFLFTCCLYLLLCAY